MLRKHPHQNSSITIGAICENVFILFLCFDPFYTTPFSIALTITLTWLKVTTYTATHLEAVEIDPNLPLYKI